MKLTSSPILLTLAAALILGCSAEPTVKLGDHVKVSYVGRLETGEVFDSTNTGQSIDFVVGAHQVIRGFENAVIGMWVGESKTITLPPDSAYGPHRPELTHVYAAGSLPDSIIPHVGQRLSMKSAEGPVLSIVVTAIDSAGNVSVDGNHELAGKTLKFDLKLVEIMEDNSQN